MRVSMTRSQVASLLVELTEAGVAGVGDFSQLEPTLVALAQVCPGKIRFGLVFENRVADRRNRTADDSESRAGCGSRVRLVAFLRRSENLDSQRCHRVATGCRPCSVWSLLSSRRGRRVWEAPAWHTSFRQAVRAVVRQGGTLIDHPSLATSPYLQTLAHRRGFRTLAVEANAVGPDRESLNLVSWLRRVVSEVRAKSERLVLSPPIEFRQVPSLTWQRIGPLLSTDPCFQSDQLGSRRDDVVCGEVVWGGFSASGKGIDHLVAALSTDLLVVQLRSKGTIERLLHGMLLASKHSNRHCLPRVWLLPPLSRDDADVKRSLIRLGANLIPVGESLSFHSGAAREAEDALRLRPVTNAILVQSRRSPASVTSRVQQREPPICRRQTTEPIRPATEATERWLLHWTREQPGPWPGQSDHEYRCDTLWNTPRADHSRLAALRRILKLNRLLASNRLTLDAARVVCFSEQPLSTYANKRVYRRHLMRWDCEHVGLVISLAGLKRQGVRPVIYGSKADLCRVDDDQRWRFQLETSGLRTQSPIAWKQEREWRVRGDVDLTQFRDHELFLFVPNEKAVEELRPLAAWPVLTVAQLSDLEQGPTEVG